MNFFLIPKSFFFLIPKSLIIIGSVIIYILLLVVAYILLKRFNLIYVKNYENNENNENNMIKNEIYMGAIAYTIAYIISVLFFLKIDKKKIRVVLYISLILTILFFIIFMYTDLLKRDIKLAPYITLPTRVNNQSSQIIRTKMVTASMNSHNNICERKYNLDELETFYYFKNDMTRLINIDDIAKYNLDTIYFNMNDKKHYLYRGLTYYEYRFNPNNIFKDGIFIVYTNNRNGIRREIKLDNSCFLLNKDNKTIGKIFFHDLDNNLSIGIVIKFE